MPARTIPEHYPRRRPKCAALGQRGIGASIGGSVTLSIPMDKPLRVGIHELVVDYLKAKLATGEQIDVAAMTYEIAQSLVDVIMEQEEGGQSVLLAYALTSLGEEYLQRRGAFDTSVKGH